MTPRTVLNQSPNPFSETGTPGGRNEQARLKSSRATGSYSGAGWARVAKGEEKSGQAAKYVREYRLNVA